MDHRATDHLLHQPHHDGSPLHVSDEAPALGSRVTLWCRTSTARPYRGVWVRSTPDAEPRFDRALEERRTSHTVWWRAEIEMRNPLQRYRFLLMREDGGYDWLTGAGVFDHDVPDAFDFVLSTYPPAPEWGRDAVVYQIFPDRFARSAQAARRRAPEWAVPADWDDEVVYGPVPETPLQYFGGDLDGVSEHLDHVAEVGADTLYLTPVFPAESNHRYNASTFEHVDPLLGGDEALQRLVEKVHARGWRVLGDLTTNHTGDTHEWFRTALADPTSAERGYYYFAEDGEDYEAWLGVPTLPKLDHTNEEMRRAFVEGPGSVVGRWLAAPYHLDGWRIDVANMTGRRADVDVAHEVARAVRTTAVEVREDALVVAEHGHDASGDLQGDGWHGTMNYVGFTAPVWFWLRGEGVEVSGFGLPFPVPRRGGRQAVSTMRLFLARFGWRAFSSSWNILGSHDTPRIRTVTGSGAMHRLAAGLQFTLPGVPMVFAGDELGLEGVVGEDSRRPMPWHRPETWDRATLSTYASLSRLRRDHVALRRGGLRWVHVDDDAVVFLREHTDETLLVVAARGGAAGDPTAPRVLTLPADVLDLADGSVLFTTAEGRAGLVRAAAADPALAAQCPATPDSALASRAPGPAAGGSGEATVTIPLDGPALTVYSL